VHNLALSLREREKGRPVHNLALSLREREKGGSVHNLALSLREKGESVLDLSPLPQGEG